MNEDNEVVINLGKVIEELLPAAIKQGLSEVGQMVENDAKRYCPVDDGTLKAHITNQVVKEDTVEIGTNVEYAPYVHEGTGIYADDGRSTPWVVRTADGKFFTTAGMPPNPFLQDAVTHNMAKIPKVFENLLEKQRGDVNA